MKRIKGKYVLLLIACLVLLYVALNAFYVSREQDNEAAPIVMDGPCNDPFKIIEEGTLLKIYDGTASPKGLENIWETGQWKRHSQRVMQYFSVRIENHGVFGYFRAYAGDRIAEYEYLIADNEMDKIISLYQGAIEETKNSYGMPGYFNLKAGETGFVKEFDNYGEFEGMLAESLFAGDMDYARQIWTIEDYGGYGALEINISLYRNNANPSLVVTYSLVE
ncbi:hypothetical protein LJC20_04065 [Eubacteriales bacterium OttesenSCG-928-M02]|nr:hypothetical protein [Eubacteriales bacterium OttesenSCG-928-M02]